MLIVFGLGVLTGIDCTIRVIKYFLEKNRSEIIYLIFGLMIASVYAIVRGPTSLEASLKPMILCSFSVMYFIAGGVFIFSLEKIKTILEKKES
ncbi:DUF368 domain-containing protein [Clostridium gasigenes]|uniref:undecaprenyl phosphate translocase family protein n=1 Tax=Clostridium gasigenes TaxID=94869 RepID=UPI0014386894|nr:DUF368 domain-containing protein [Clostridium gasigenes]MBU3089965.1 DUF368 domain-containing protein [Clostridium gasigenes]NKF08579.1 DUF368 domain-containing protein [Clostridium gasigenes]QSW19586.1 DUF368 domain-containing protein [Clostridium gasigenes]